MALVSATRRQKTLRIRRGLWALLAFWVGFGLSGWVLLGGVLALMGWNLGLHDRRVAQDPVG